MLRMHSVVLDWKRKCQSEQVVLALEIVEGKILALSSKRDKQQWHISNNEHT
jgi:hypothetical protein